MAKERGVPVKETTAEKLQALSGISSHQGVAAVLSAAAYSQMEDIFRRAGFRPPATSVFVFSSIPSFLSLRRWGRSMVIYCLV